MELAITYPDGNTFSVTPDDTSYRHREVMGEDALTLKFSSPVHVELPVGSWCEFQGTRYTLYRPEALTMHHSRSFEYTVTMEAEQWLAGIWMFRDVTDGRVSFTLTAKPSEHLKLLVDNLNARAGEGHWEVGDCVDAEEACIGYDRVRCSEALDLMAEAFGTEWEFSEWAGEDGATRRTVSLHKVEYDRDDPLALAYGRGRGFLPDVGRGNSSDEPPVEALYPQGGTDNVSAGSYPESVHGEGEYPSDVERPMNSAVLLLPPGRRIAYDGSEFFYEGDSEWGMGDKLPALRRYEVDGQGYSVARLPEDVEADGAVRLGAEDSLDCTDICPKRVGTVAEVIAVAGTDDDGEPQQWYDFTDADPDSCPDYSECLIDGETMTVIFQSGALAGREFEVNYVHEGEDGKAPRRFEVVSELIDGVLMPQGPGEAFGINPGDTYAVFGCMLPNEYICDDASHSGAEWDMLRKCAVYMYEHGEEHPTITGKMDGIWSAAEWDDIGPRVRPGRFVLFTDERFEPDGLLIRIVGVKDYINRPQSPELELSDETRGLGAVASFRLARSRELVLGDSVGRVSGDLTRAVGRVGRGGSLTARVGDLENVVVGEDGGGGLSRSVGDLEDAIWGDDGVEDDRGIAGKVSDLEGDFYGTDDADGAVALLVALQNAVTTLNAAMTDVYDALGKEDFTGYPVEGSYGTWNPGTVNPGFGN